MYGLNEARNGFFGFIPTMSGNSLGGLLGSMVGIKYEFGWRRTVALPEESDSEHGMQ
jgi:hypothetical protein